MDNVLRTLLGAHGVVAGGAGELSRYRAQAG